MKENKRGKRRRELKKRDGERERLSYTIHYTDHEEQKKKRKRERRNKLPSGQRNLH